MRDIFQGKKSDNIVDNKMNFKGFTNWMEEAFV